jgi:DNA-directed RNA polymerase subunit RPC12/RpoP
MTKIIEECEICNYRPDKKDIERCPNCGGKIIIKVEEGLDEGEQRGIIKINAIELGEK